MVFLFYSKRQEWGQFKEEHFAQRLFYFKNCSLPHGLGAMSYDQPARDGSTCSLMARSLRKMLQLDFTVVMLLTSNTDDITDSE